MARPLTGDCAIADERLAAWGDWARSDNAHVGWPARTVLGRVIDEGFTGAAQGRPPPVEIPAGIAETERLIAGLPPKYKRIIKIWYASNARFDQSAAAERARMSHRKFCDALRVARELIAYGLLCGKQTVYVPHGAVVSAGSARR